MRNCFVFIVVCFFLSVQVNAQDVSGFSPGLLEYWNAAAFESGNSYVNQLGNHNNIVVIQQQTGESVNVVNSYQFDSYNEAYIKQVGSEHVAYLSQKGEGNEVNIWQFGNYSFTTALQEGTANNISSYIDNQDIVIKATYLVQKGNNNSIELSLTGMGYSEPGLAEAANIQQTGNNLQVTANLDSYSSPIIIRQQSGVSGAGMKVNVSNSDFYFPLK